MLKITPEIITDFKRYHVCDENQALIGIEEHENVYNAIKEQNPGKAKEMMKEHFKALYQFCYHT